MIRIHPIFIIHARTPRLYLLVLLLLLLCPSPACKSRPSEAQGSPPPGKPKQEARPKKVVKPGLPSLKAQHHPVYSLLDNRLAAHLVRGGGMFIPAGYPGTAKYMSFGRPWRAWKINRTVAGRRAAVSVRPIASLNFPLSKAQQAADKLTLSLYSPVNGQGLKLRINKARLKTVKLDKGWKTVTVPLRPSYLRAENRLELNWMQRGRINGDKAPGALEWVHLHRGEALTGEVVTAPTRGKGKGLYLPKEGGAAYYVHPYAGAKLRLMFPAQAAAGRCGVRVSFTTTEAADAVEVVRTEMTLAAGKEVNTYVDLKGVAGQVARVELTATGATCKELILSEASIVMPGAAPTVKRAAPPDNVIFWMIDNVRADRYKAYNPKTRVKTPIINELVRTGTVFTRAYIQGTESRVSHATLWTGLYPKQHRFIRPKAKLSKAWITIPEGARKAGLYTAAWIANGFVSKFWGFGEGWDRFRNTLHDGGGLTAERLANHAVKFITQHGDRRFYLYVGTIDPHVSWRGRQPWLDQYYPEPYSGRYKRNVMGTDVGKMAVGKLRVSARDRKRIRAVNDSTVSYNDAQLGRLVEALKQKGIRDKTMIVITADHGEELWDYGKIGHGNSVRHELVAVPLIIHYPPLFGAGVKVTEGVDVGSVFPSIMDALGAPIPEKVQTESLLPLAQGLGRGYPRPSMATQLEFSHTMRLQEWKLRVGGKGVPRLYDLSSTEPQRERRDLSGKRPLETRWLTDALSTFLIYQDRWRARRWGVASNHKAALAEDLETGKGPKRIRPY